MSQADRFQTIMALAQRTGRVTVDSLAAQFDVTLQTIRRDLNDAAKTTIARNVARDVPNGCSIFLNIGTTTEAVARALLDHRDIMVLTNNLNVANILVENPNYEVIVVGGLPRRTDGGLVGVSQTILRHAQSAFLAADRSKFQRRAPARIGSLAQIDCLYTDAPLSAALQGACAHWGTAVHVVAPDAMAD